MKNREIQIKYNTRYAVVRETEGRHWIDTETIHGLQYEAQKIADKTDAQIPQWAKDNKQIGVFRVKITLEQS